MKPKYLTRASEETEKWTRFKSPCVIPFARPALLRLQNIPIKQWTVFIVQQLTLVAVDRSLVFYLGSCSLRHFISDLCDERSNFDFILFSVHLHFPCSFFFFKFKPLYCMCFSSGYENIPAPNSFASLKCVLSAGTFYPFLTLVCEKYRNDTEWILAVA